MSAVAILWLRRDLRLRDHPALAAAAQADRLVPAFCLDPRLLGGRHRSGARTQFLLDCLHDVDRSLRDLGSRLVIRNGIPEQELAALARDVGARTVHATADVGPYARRRDDAVSSALAACGLELVLYPGLFVVDDPAEIRTGDGGPYTVFTPYHRSWERAPRREPLHRPHSLPGLPTGVRTGRIPALKSLGLRQPLADPPAGGERAGGLRLEAFLADGVDSYDERRDALETQRHIARCRPTSISGACRHATSRHRLPSAPGAAELRRQLCWRDFYAQVLRSFPRNAQVRAPGAVSGAVAVEPRARKPSMRGARAAPGIRWSTPRCASCAAKAGSTTKARLIVGSFLTKDLGIDWRWGERWFMELLVDGDEASNNGNWQWIASVGVDPQPPSRRIYNPTRQQERFDPAAATCAATCPSCARPRRVPGRAVDDACRGPAAPPAA